MMKLHIVQNRKIIPNFLKYSILILAGLNLYNCSGCSKSGLNKAINRKQQTVTVSTQINSDSTSNIVRMEKHNGVYHIPVEINGVPMYFIFDTGASLISISSKESIKLYREGKLNSEDILGKGSFTYANGEISEGTIIVLREVKIGTKILQNIQASVVDNLDAPLLIGQSALGKFGKISIDYGKNEILFE